MEEGFGCRHTLSSWHEAGGAFTIAFCGSERGHGRTYLEGTLAISADTVLLSARWRYRTPRPDEHAGGEVDFMMPPSGRSVWLLIPTRGVFWRRIAGSRTLFHQRTEVYTSWRMGRGIWAHGTHDRPPL